MTDYNELVDKHLEPLREAAINTMAEYATLGATIAVRKVKECVKSGDLTVEQAVEHLLVAATLLERDFRHSWVNAALQRATENGELFGLSPEQRDILGHPAE